MEYKPTVVFDFDGVIHSYTSGWRGAENVPDPVVPGIKDTIDQLRELDYKVAVVSTRCATTEGMGAVMKYLYDNGIHVDNVMAEKPPALCYIDDRAICFRGDAGKLVDQIQNFKSWVEAPAQNDSPVKTLRPCKAIAYQKRLAYEVKGRFHRWGDGYEEFDNGAAGFTTAIIELDDGQIVSCPAETVKFLDRGV